MAANPNKLIVAMTVKEAERIRDAFGLSPQAWYAVGFASCIGSGWRYDRVVVQLPDVLSPEIKDVVQHLRTLTTVDGELIFI